MTFNIANIVTVALVATTASAIPAQSSSDCNTGYIQLGNIFGKPMTFTLYSEKVRGYFEDGTFDDEKKVIVESDSSVKLCRVEECHTEEEILIIAHNPNDEEFSSFFGVQFVQEEGAETCTMIVQSKHVAYEMAYRYSKFIPSTVNDVGHVNIAFCKPEDYDAGCGLPEK
eukprot:Clim_evm4s185 gene=Clim_evmTU4s185